jgi:hypothetical protein
MVNFGLSEFPLAGGFMPRMHALAALFLSSTIGFAQASKPAWLDAPTTLPIVFTQSISADHAKVGDLVSARTIQAVQLPGGGLIPSRTRVTGHVIATNGFAYDKTPYAHQKQSTLSIRFDSLEMKDTSLPLNVTVRAIADPITSWDADKPKSTDLDSLSTLTQIGGDRLVPSQSEVVNRDGDVVAYNRRGGVYAHLIGNGSCDGSTVEVSVGLYSASACGVYGFSGVTALERGSTGAPSTLTLVSTHGSPKLWKHTTALLEVLPTQQATIAR